MPYCSIIYYIKCGTKYIFYCEIYILVVYLMYSRNTKKAIIAYEIKLYVNQN